MTKTAMRIAVWTGVAVLAAGVATAAVAASRSGGSGVLSPEDVAAQLAADNTGTGGGAADPAGGDHGTDANGTSGTGAASTPAASTDASAGRVVNTTGGTMVVNCQGTTAALVSWTPNSGYRADDPVRGPGAAVSLKFESDTADDVMVSVTCANGQALKKEFVETDDHGGDRGGSGGSGSDD